MHLHSLMSLASILGHVHEISDKVLSQTKIDQSRLAVRALSSFGLETSNGEQGSKDDPGNGRNLIKVVVVPAICWHCQ